VLVPIPVKSNAQHGFLGRKIVERFQEVIAGRLVDFGGDSPDAIRQMGLFNFFPGAVGVGAFW
jgi:hypothetical protein